MIYPPSSYVLSPVVPARRMLVPAVVLAVMASLGACSSSADDEPAGDAVAEPTTDEETLSDDPDGATDDRGASAGDVGNATLRIGGVEFPDFVGSCDLGLRSQEDVGDLSTLALSDLTTVIGIDNVEAHPETMMNFTAVGAARFRFRDQADAAGAGTTAKGEITALTELGPRTASGSRDIVEVRFAGALEDGTSFEADVVCEIQNAF